MLPMRGLEVKVVLVWSGPDERLTEHPALLVITKTTDAVSAIRYSRAMAFWAAARTELTLSDAGEGRWDVCNPVWRGQQELEDGWQTSWIVRLDASEGARSEAAMKALREVVEGLSETIQSQYSERSRLGERQCTAGNRPQ